MAPIRVALIGLSASAKTSWAAEGHLPYLLSAQGRAHYDIVALLNSTVERAEQAREYFNLPNSVKAYGSPHDLAQDSDIDLVVCNTRVDSHFETVLPSVEAGKSVFVEWPLADTLERAKELHEKSLSKASIIGLQGRMSPVILKVKQLLAQSQIGQILSSDVEAFGSLLPQDELPEGLAYFADRKVGGYSANIAFGHMIDFVHDTLGEYENFTSRMQIRWPRMKIFDKSGTKIRTVDSDVPDLVTVTGPLFPNATPGGHNVVSGATLTVNYRNGPPFPGTPGFVWNIVGSDGEIRVTSHHGPYLNSDSYGEAIDIELYDFNSKKVQKVPWEWNDWQKQLPVRSRHVGVLYERYANWIENNGTRPPPADIPDESRWPQLGDAVQRHEEIQLMFDAWDATNPSAHKGKGQ